MGNRGGERKKEKRTRRGREREREGKRERGRGEEVPWPPSGCLSGMLITSHLPVQARDEYVSSKHLLFELPVLALFLRNIPTSVFFHL